MEKGNTITRSLRWHLAAVFIPLLLFAAYRSVSLDITNDEAYSFKLVAELTRHFQGARNLMLGTANTHWLNTFFLFIEYHVLGNKVWMIRIHSVLALLVLARACYILLQNEKSLTLFWTVLTFLVCNHYFFDFYSLARGYALSMSFEVLAFAWIIQDAEKNRTKIYNALALALISNYTAIMILVVYGLLDAFSIWKKERWKGWFSKKFYSQRWAAILVCAWAIPNIYVIKYITKDLEEGLRNGFLADSMGMFIGRSWDVLNYPGILVVAVLWTISLLGYYVFFRKKMEAGWKLLFETTWWVVVLIHICYYALHIPFPCGRTGFFITLPMLLLLAYVLSRCIHAFGKTSGYVIAIGLFIANAFYLSQYRDFRVTVEWWMQQGMQEFVMDCSRREGAQIKSKTISMNLDHWGVYCNYYQFIYPEKTMDTVIVYDRTGYPTIPGEVTEQMKHTDYLLWINDYDAYMKAHWTAPYPQVIKRYNLMRSDWLQQKK